VSGLGFVYVPYRCGPDKWIALLCASTSTATTELEVDVPVAVSKRICMGGRLAESHDSAWHGVCLLRRYAAASVAGRRLAGGLCWRLLDACSSLTCARAFLIVKAAWSRTQQRGRRAFASG